MSINGGKFVQIIRNTGVITRRQSLKVGQSFRNNGAKVLTALTTRVKSQVHVYKVGTRPEQFQPGRERGSKKAPPTRVYNRTKPFIPSWFDSLRSIRLHFQGASAVSAGLKRTVWKNIRSELGDSQPACGRRQRRRRELKRLLR